MADLNKLFAGVVRPCARWGASSPRGPLLLSTLLSGCMMFAPPILPVASTPKTPDVAKRYPWMADVRWTVGVQRPSAADETAIAEDIDALLTGDFDVYPVAARRLIARGEQTLPCLGQAADRHPAPSAHRERISIVLRPILRDLPAERMPFALASPYATVRAHAAAATGARRLDPLGPRLIELLEDRDIRVRRAAIASLRMLTGEFLAYQPDASPSQRAASAAAWGDFWHRKH